MWFTKGWQKTEFENYYEFKCNYHPYFEDYRIEHYKNGTLWRFYYKDKEIAKIIDLEKEYTERDAIMWVEGINAVKENERFIKARKIGNVEINKINEDKEKFDMTTISIQDRLNGWEKEEFDKYFEFKNKDEHFDFKLINYKNVPEMYQSKWRVYLNGNCIAKIIDLKQEFTDQEMLIWIDGICRGYEYIMNAAIERFTSTLKEEKEKIWYSGGIISIKNNVNEDEMKKVIKSGVLDKTISNAMSRETNRRGIRR